MVMNLKVEHGIPQLKARAVVVDFSDPNTVYDNVKQVRFENLRKDKTGFL